MSLLNGLDLVANSKIRAIPSFDIGGGNIDFIRASFEACDAVNGSVFLSSTPSTVKNYLGYKKYVDIINVLASDYKTNYAIHLDHAQNVEDVLEAIDSGFTSVMYDGSHLPIDQNIHNTLIVKSYAKKLNVTVEAEIGIIEGKEDEIEANACLLPSIDDVLLFLEKTEVEFLAPAVGTVHGFFNGKPEIDYELIEKLPFNEHNFVLHGCTGLNNKILKRLSNHGFCKFNFATILRKTYRNALLESINHNPEFIKPYVIMNSAKKSLKKYLVELISAINL